jgi:hypothetical protein
MIRGPVRCGSHTSMIRPGVMIDERELVRRSMLDLKGVVNRAGFGGGS